MNKLIAPLLLILIFATSSCSDDAKKSIQKIARQDSEQTSTDVTGDKTILNAGLGNFCEGHECPDGIVAVKTNTKKLTCAGIVKSENEILISNNCATKDDNFNVQTTEGKLLKVASVEEELTNEFGDKVLKLNLDEKISSTANIDLPELDDHNVTLFNFNELGELQSQDCELTYASLAYANSFDNESQLLNIKNCDGVRDGSLISQNGKTIGFLTKKHDEIDLYEGISLNGFKTTETIAAKIDSLSLNYDSNDTLVLGLYASEIPIMKGEYSNQEIIFNEQDFSFEVNTLCLNKDLEEAYEDEKIKILFNNDLYEFNEESKIKVIRNTTYIPMKFSMVVSFNQPLGDFNKDHKHIIYDGSLSELAQANNYSNVNKTEDIFYIITPINDDRYKTKNINLCK